MVPTASVRFGSFIGENTVLMPSFVNIGAFVGNGTMVDMGYCWFLRSNRRKCSPIGRSWNWRVLEPLQAAPTIIEDNCFIGARSEVVEGVVVKKLGNIHGSFYRQINENSRPRNRRYTLRHCPRG